VVALIGLNSISFPVECRVSRNRGAHDSHCGKAFAVAEMLLCSIYGAVRDAELDDLPPVPQDVPMSIS